MVKPMQVNQINQKTANDYFKLTCLIYEKGKMPFQDEQYFLTCTWRS